MPAKKSNADAPKDKPLTKLQQLIRDSHKPGSEVEAADIRYAGLSSDYHTNVWKWQCGACGWADNPKIDTMFRQYSKSCERCTTTNIFDFRKYGA